MKSTLLLLFVAVAACSVQATQVMVRVHYPQANLQSTNLFLRGDALGLNWKSGLALKHTNANLWEAVLNVSSSDVGSTLSMKVLIDDSTWQQGANSMWKLTSQNGYADLYPWFFSTQGSYAIAGSIYSPQLHNSRDMIVYVPPSYSENSLKTYDNVLVMHDGENLFNASTSFAGVAWDCQDTVNSMVGEGKMEEIVIVGLYNTVNRTYEYTPSQGRLNPGGKLVGGGGDKYLDFIEQQALPYAAKNYRIDVSSRQNLGMIGSSLGGLLSCYAGWTRAATYGRVGCMSSSFWWAQQHFNTTVIPSVYPPPKQTIYLDSGNAGPDDDDVTQTQTVRNHFESLGFTIGFDLFYYLDNGGMHSEKYWGDRFHVPMADLYSPTAKPLTPV